MQGFTFNARGPEYAEGIAFIFVHYVTELICFIVGWWLLAYTLARNHKDLKQLIIFINGNCVTKNQNAAEMTDIRAYTNFVLQNSPFAIWGMQPTYPKLFISITVPTAALGWQLARRVYDATKN